MLSAMNAIQSVRKAGMDSGLHREGVSTDEAAAAVEDVVWLDVAEAAVNGCLALAACGAAVVPAENTRDYFLAMDAAFAVSGDDPTRRPPPSTSMTTPVM